MTLYFYSVKELVGREKCWVTFAALRLKIQPSLHRTFLFNNDSILNLLVVTEPMDTSR